MKVKSLSHVQLLATPWPAAYQAPPSMGFSRQEYWSGVPLPSLHKHLQLPSKWLLCVLPFTTCIDSSTFVSFISLFPPHIFLISLLLFKNDKFFVY